MRWLWAAIAGVALVLVWQGLNPLFRGSDPADVAAGASTPASELAPEATSTKALEGVEWDEPQRSQIPEPTPEPQRESAEGSEDGVINIGEPMDPNDPSTWPRSENTEVINIGEPMNPDDPSTWSQPENTEVINIGEPMDPDDPSTWPQPENTEVINIGEPIYPDDPSTSAQPENTEVINIGEPKDPDNPSTWD
jgi:hypothetical protein